MSLHSYVVCPLCSEWVTDNRDLDYTGVTNMAAHWRTCDGLKVVAATLKKALVKDDEVE